MTFQALINLVGSNMEILKEFTAFFLVLCLVLFNLIGIVHKKDIRLFYCFLEAIAVILVVLQGISVYDTIINRVSVFMENGVYSLSPMDNNQTYLYLLFITDTISVMNAAALAIPMLKLTRSFAATLFKTGDYQRAGQAAGRVITSAYRNLSRVTKKTARAIITLSFDKTVQKEV